METTTIRVVVKLTVASDEKLTENDKEQVVIDTDYSFDFTEILNGNHVAIVDTEIVETLEPD